MVTEIGFKNLGNRFKGILRPSRGRKQTVAPLLEEHP